MTELTIPLSMVTFSDLERRYVLEAIDELAVSSTGPHVRRFEEQLTRTIGAGHAVATASGTSALELVLRALDIGAGDEVVVPALSFAAPALAVLLVGATPVFADITEETWTIDPDDVRTCMTKRTRAVMAVDVLGHPCDYDRLSDLGVPIIEDAAEAHGATYKGRSAGTLGVAAIFSFHANKAIACGEGGCVVTSDKAFADRIRQLNAFGMAPDRRYWHTEVGCNHRMTNLTAAVGLGQMEKWDELLAGRARVAAAYDHAFASLPLQRRPVAPWAGEAVWLYTLAADRREAILTLCRQRGIDARGIWPSLPENPVFLRHVRRACPIARRIAATAFWLPTWSDMPDDSMGRVCSAIREACAGDDGPSEGRTRA